MNTSALRTCCWGCCARRSVSPLNCYANKASPWTRYGGGRMLWTDAVSVFLLTRDGANSRIPLVNDTGSVQVPYSECDSGIGFESAATILGQGCSLAHCTRDVFVKQI